MKVLTVYAHHNPRSFCHAILERFSAGLADGGHANEVVDLHAIGFDPVLRERDEPNWIDDSVPDDVLRRMRIQNRDVIRKLHAFGCPRDVAEQQQKVARADALAFIAPVYFVGFPAILKGWIERVFTLGFAFGLKPEAWRGDIGGRTPLLAHRKALIISTTIFDRAAYESGLGAAMQLLIDEFALRYPGIKVVEHVYFYAVHGADDAARAAYLERSYRLGRDFGTAG